MKYSLFHICVLLTIFDCLITEASGQILRKDSAANSRKLFSKLKTNNTLDSLSNLKRRITLSADAIYDLRYVGPTPIGYSSKPVIQNIGLQAKAIVFGLPIEFNYSYGNGMFQSQRMMPMFSFRLNPEILFSHYQTELIELGKKQLQDKLESDTLFQRYLTINKQIQYYDNFINQTAYQQSIVNAQTIVSQNSYHENDSLHDDALIVEDAKSRINEYHKVSSLLDSLKKEKTKLEKSNDDYIKYAQKPEVNMGNYSEMYTLMGLLVKSPLLPSWLKGLANVRKFSIGICYPSDNAIIFNGAGIRGGEISLSNKHFYTELVTGRQLSTGNFFHDSLMVSNNRVIYSSIGFQNQLIKVGTFLYAYFDQPQNDTTFYHYNFSAPSKSIIPGMQLSVKSKHFKGTLQAAYDMESGYNKEIRLENEAASLGRQQNSYWQRSIAQNASVSGDLSWNVSAKGPAFTMTYRYTGKDFRSPSSPFAPPFQHFIELKTEQSLFKQVLGLQAGLNYKSNLQTGNTSGMQDKTFSGFVSAGFKMKRMPSIQVRYFPLYRESVWKGNSLNLYIKQWIATVSYSYQFHRNLYVFSGSFVQQSIAFSNSSQNNTTLVAYQYFQPAKLPFNMSVTAAWFNKQMAISQDSTNMYSLRTDMNYTKMKVLQAGVYIDLSQAPNLNRRVFGIQGKWNSKIMGLFNFRVGYGAYIYSDHLQKGFNVSCTLYKKLL